MMLLFVNKLTIIKSKKMRYTLTLLILFSLEFVFAQADFPDFLQGTWKMENKEVYEHWDRLNESSLKGFSYKLEDKQMIITEYLDISNSDEGISYTATVLNQNQGRGINFMLTKSDSVFTFENPDHDFPKMIVYQKLNDLEILVQVSDGKQNGFAYIIQKQFQENFSNENTIANTAYDPVLAEKLGADDYGMKNYFLVILKTGMNTSADSELISKSFRGHLDNIQKMVDEGKLIVAGPLGKNENNYRGIFILSNIASVDGIKQLLLADAAIENGFLDYDIYTWYGSAALSEYLPVSNKIRKLNP